MARNTLHAIVAIFLAAACQAGSEGGAGAGLDAALPVDASRDLKGGLSQFLLIREEMSECLPRTLEMERDGRAACYMLVVLPSGITCDPPKGLTAADPRLITLLSRSLLEPLGSSTVCEANQLELTDLVNGDCVAAQTPGWCLIQRFDAAPCLQGIHRSPAFVLPPDARMFATCWFTP
jgi:hypothetical protein